MQRRVYKQPYGKPLNSYKFKVLKASVEIVLKIQCPNCQNVNDLRVLEAQMSKDVLIQTKCTKCGWQNTVDTNPKERKLTEAEIKLKECGVDPDTVSTKDKNMLNKVLKEM